MQAKEWPRVFQVKSAVTEWERQIYLKLAERKETTLSDLIRAHLASLSVREGLMTQAERDKLLGE